ncbi:cell wall hydrolase [Loktanella sp. DJP18]|uniref:cell wall hydrolase n=1 Tax=Loktanella sp. DJP18 TaxID=3409788 RepID=UPI003BB71B60
MIRSIALAVVAVVAIGTTASANESSEDYSERRAAAAQPEYSLDAAFDGTIDLSQVYAISAPTGNTGGRFSTKTAPIGHTLRLNGQVTPDTNIGALAVPTTLEGSNSLTCLAVAIYHEARNQSEFGQRAVASVILQRAAVKGRWGSKPCDVVVPVQFSFMLTRYTFEAITERDAWQRSVAVARATLAIGPLPELQGADHYHTTGVNPGWASRIILVRQIGDHKFYVDPSSRTGRTS